MGVILAEYFCGFAIKFVSFAIKLIATFKNLKKIVKF
jgi:hypothetical protein